MAVEKGTDHGITHRTSSSPSISSPKESNGPLAILGGRPLLSNRGIPLNLDWVEQVRVNTSAVERRAQSHTARRSVKKEWQAAWLLRAVTCMDLTTLSGDDTEERVRRLCAKAKQPIQQELVKQLGDIAGRQARTSKGLAEPQKLSSYLVIFMSRRDFRT